MTPRRIATYAASSAASGVLGWIAKGRPKVIGIFEGWYWASSFATHLRRERQRKRV